MEFRVLGPLEVRRDGRPVDVRGSKRRAVLALLVLQANEVVRTDRLIEDLWGADRPANAPAALHNHLSRLRKDLGGDILVTKPWGYVLRAAPEAIDLRRFESIVDEARPLPPGERSAKLAEALALWRGPALVDLAHEPALTTELGRLDELREAVVEQRIDADLALGREVGLVPELELLVERHPLRERLWGQLMLSLYRTGRQAEALATYRRVHAVLVSELAIEPGPALRDLQRAILVQDPRLDEREGKARDELVERIAPLLPTDDRRRARALYEYGVALWLLGERERSNAALGHAAKGAVAADDRSLEELAELRLSWQALFTRRASPAAHLARARKAGRVFEKLANRSNLAHALEHEGLMLRDLGRAEAAATVFERAACLAQEEGDVSQANSCRDLLCSALMFGPMPVEQAIARCQAEVATAERQGRHPFWGWVCLGSLYAQKEPAGGIAFFDRAERASREAALSNQLALTFFYRSWVYELIGDWASAERELRSAFEHFGTMADRGTRQLVAGRLARALVALGEVDEAEELAEAASKAGAADDFYEQVAWRQGLALVHARRGRHVDARRVAREAVELVAGSDSLNQHAEALADLAAVQEANDNPGESISLLDEAMALYERKGNLVARGRALASRDRLRSELA